MPQQQTPMLTESERCLVIAVVSQDAKFFEDLRMPHLHGALARIRQKLKLDSTQELTGWARHNFALLHPPGCRCRTLLCMALHAGAEVAGRKRA